MKTTATIDLLGAQLPAKETRLGYMPKKQMLAEIRKIFPHAKEIRK